jgi:DNA-binding LytR/AlgR family response regulator
MNQPLKALIIEDEELLAKALKDKIAKVDPDITIIDILPSLKTARKWLMQEAMPDLFFMDIQLSDGISFDLFNDYHIQSPVIFTTAYDEYAIRAFKVNGVDYLLKPINQDELTVAITKARHVIGRQAVPADLKQLLQSLSQPRNEPVYKEKFMVSIRNQWMPVSSNSIACFMKDNLIYCYLHTGEKYILDYPSLDEIEELVDPRLFYRASRQSIIHLEAVQTIKTQGNSKLIIRLKPPLDKMEIDMSRLKAPDFKKWLDR